MNVNNVIRPPKRFSTAYLSMLNIQAYGTDNLYPQRMYDLIQNSPTGGSCLDRYQTFIEGNGLNNTSFSEYVCNSRGDTVDDIFRLIARDMAYFHGFALHVNYNLACEIVEVSNVPFMNCRLEEEDEQGKVTYINVHPDWSGQRTRKGKKITVDKKNIDKIFLFNPIPSVVMAQIQECGGIENYKGQILWFSMDGRFEYPKPIYDKVVTNLSADEGLDNVKYRNIRNNFLLSGMFIHKKGMTIEFDEQGQPVQRKTEDYDFARNLDTFQGDTNCCSIMDIELNADEDEPKFVPVEGTNYDAKFTCTEESVVERIYSAFGQEPWFSIRKGKTGFTGQILEDAYEYYNSYVSSPRRAISRELKRVFSQWHEVVNETDDYEVQPLVYVSNKDNETTPNNA